uniref:Protein kinase domain-containing protein n=1 Tax=Moniliophthora roreri TaxID=221103 RepID=A0A0W0G7R4_MONRR
MSIFISGVKPVQDGRCCFGGTFGDAFKSFYGDSQAAVALKRLRTFQNDQHDARHKIFQKFCKEALIWRQLEHKFVLPFLGIDAENFPRHPCMVSPWMVNGTIIQFLKKNPRANINGLLFGIVQGIDYLHSKKVVHGDIKGCNILIDENCQPRLADFGLTVFADATRHNTTDHGGTIQWMAPELLFSPGESQRRTFASDIYAYGCVCVEVYTGKPPFPDTGEARVILEVSAGKRPKRPNMMSDALWSLVETCWHENRNVRPRSQQAVAELDRMIKSTNAPTASTYDLGQARELG